MVPVSLHLRRYVRFDSAAETRSCVGNALPSSGTWQARAPSAFPLASLHNLCSRDHLQDLRSVIEPCEKYSQRLAWGGSLWLFAACCPCRSSAQFGFSACRVPDQQQLQEPCRPEEKAQFCRGCTRNSFQYYTRSAGVGQYGSTKACTRRVQRSPGALGSHCVRGLPRPRVGGARPCLCKGR